MKTINHALTLTILLVLSLIVVREFGSTIKVFGQTALERSESLSVASLFTITPDFYILPGKVWTAEIPTEADGTVAFHRISVYNFDENVLDVYWDDDFRFDSKCPNQMIVIYRSVGRNEVGMYMSSSRVVSAGIYADKWSDVLTALDWLCGNVPYGPSGFDYFIQG